MSNSRPPIGQVKGKNPALRHTPEWRAGQDESTNWEINLKIAPIGSNNPKIGT